MSAPARLVRTALARAGLRLRRAPRPLAEHPEAELGIDLDFVLAHHLARELPGDFFFVQVGGYDGRTNDPLHDHVVRRGWRGVIVEPQSAAFAALEETYREAPQVALRNVAIADAPGTREIWKIAPGPGLPAWAPQLASFRKEALLAHRDVIPDVAARIVSETVACETFEGLLRTVGAVGTLAPDRIDLLQIDAEGYDAELVRLFFASGRTAEIVQFEHKHLARGEHDRCCASLIDRGYRLALCGPDTLAYRG